MDQKDVVIVGGGPAGLSAALVLGRSRKQVLVCDGGTPRNARAEHMQGFVTQDGTPPKEFRRLAREQFAPYAIEHRSTLVSAIERLPAGFLVSTADGRTVKTRQILLATGMVDVLPDLPGYRDAWGTSIVQCPYCHGWEVRDTPLGVLATNEMLLDFALFVTGWSRDVIAFTGGAFKVTAERRRQFAQAGVRLEERPLAALHVNAGSLESVGLADGTRVERTTLFAHPPQRQVALVTQLGLDLDDEGFVRTDFHKETSIPGIYAAGDLTTRLQSAVVSAAAGATAAYMMNHRLTAEDAVRGRLAEVPSSR